MTTRLTCPLCKARFTRPTGSRRVHCEVCRPPRKAPRVVPAAGPVAVPGPSVPVEPGLLELAAVDVLTRAKRLGTFEGALFLRLAREADQSTGEKISRLIPGMLKAKELALAGWKEPSNDVVDRLSAARARKAESA